MLRTLLAVLLLLLLATTCADAAPYNFLDNYKPSPPPDQGPPASVHANRNKSTRAAEWGAVVGGYVFTVLIWGVLLSTVGRRMRRKTETSPKTLELELVTARPPSKVPTSPQSARSATSWLKKGFRRNSQNDSAAVSPTSPVVHSPASFDQKVIEADRERAQAEMERLYAAVMDHDRKKSLSKMGAAEQGDEDEDARRLGKIDTSQEAATRSNPGSPMKAIYPPGYHNGPPSAPLPRDRMRDQPPASPRSILSKKSQTSVGSSNSKTRFNLKKLRISGPILKYPGDRDDEARTPLSPRFYNPGAPPSPPTQQNSPTARQEEEEYEKLDEVQPLPRPAPQRLASTSSAPVVNKSATSSSSSLPLRGYNEPLKSPNIQTTFVDHRMDKLSLTTPRTGVPYTPYSPYMPFTPVTPVTPHLVTKKERKTMKKINGKQLARGDMVQSPKDIFGDAY